jgi:DNA/RNA-binding domain of Phe-tRNA-synthetase-like protein
MSALSYSIADEVFVKYPGYVRGVLLAYDVVNCPSPAELITLLREAEASVRTQMSIESVAEHPRIKSWREAYRAFGAKPSEFRSSIEAMARRVLRNDPLPSINALVDIGNIASLKYLVPVGGHALDDVKDNLALRPALGDEIFVPFDSDESESPLPGEIIFAEGKTVLTRRWTWRQARHTLTLLSTRAIEFNVDGLPPVERPEVERICVEVGEMVSRFCGGRWRYEVLSPDTPSAYIGEA